MRVLRSGTALAVLFAAAAVIARPAAADVITTFTLDGVTMVDGGALTGNFQLDATTSTITGVDIALSGSSTYVSQTFTSTSAVPSYCTFCSPTSQYDEFRISDPTSGIDIYFDVNDPLSLNGSNPLIPDPSNADQFSDVDGQNNVVGIVAGALDATSATVPEPTSAALLGAGLLLLGGARRRSRRS